MSLGEIQYHPMKNRILPLTLREKQKKKKNVKFNPERTRNYNTQFSDKATDGAIPDIPAFMQSEIISTDRDFGPSVPTILVIAGKTVCRQYIRNNE
jgi:hypothetical protein